jgi:hypothetical protein
MSELFGAEVAPKPRIVLAVVGSRSFRDFDRLKTVIDTLRRQFRIDAIVSGGAQGADRLAERYAKYRGIELRLFKADWNGPRGRGAGLARNSDIVAAADYVLAFWDGVSSGTADALAKAEKAGKTIQKELFIPQL